MATAKIDPGICGFLATVRTRPEGERCAVEIECDCEPIQKMAAAMPSVDPMEEIGFHRDGPLTLRMFAEHCPHPSCPIPAGILKAVEVECGLALPKNATIEIEK